MTCDGTERAPSVSAPIHQQEHRRVGGERLAVVTALDRFDYKACPFDQVLGLESVGVSEGHSTKCFLTTPSVTVSYAKRITRTWVTRSVLTIVCVIS